MRHPEQVPTIPKDFIEQELCSTIGIIDQSATQCTINVILPDIRTISINSLIKEMAVWARVFEVTPNTFNGYLGFAHVAVNKPQLTGIFMALDLACQRRPEVTPSVAALVNYKSIYDLLHGVRSFPGQRLPANRTVFVLLTKFPVTFAAENVVMFASVDWGLPNGVQAHRTLQGFHQFHHHIIRIFGLCACHLRR